MTSPLLALVYLLAAAPGNKGRQRYAPKRGKRASNRKGAVPKQQPDVLPPPPPPTNPNGPFPTYYTCRHSYEDALLEELLLLDDDSSITASSSVCPGLVCIESTTSDDKRHTFRDPVYALQVLPECRIIKVSNSIKGLAQAIGEITEFSPILQEAPKGSLVIHALVPGMCKGQREPKLLRRANLVADALSELWKKRFPAARKDDCKEECLLLQIMLFSNDSAAASLRKCRRSLDDNDNNFMTMCWPNPNLPVGLANVDIVDTKMPSSAYRKLLEAFACWQCMPRSNDVVVDLGASPGGWTFAVLLHSQPKKIIAVDRAELDPRLMNHASVEFVQGDAFAYRPSEPVDWMMSDIIAYPKRIVELLETWCSNRLATKMVVTIKFQGDTPSWQELQQAIDVAQSHNYHVRAKHFFNNKNEVTLMLQHKDTVLVGMEEDSNDAIRGPIYERAWPKGK